VGFRGRPMARIENRKTFSLEEENPSPEKEVLLGALDSQYPLFSYGSERRRIENGRNLLLLRLREEVLQKKAQIVR
jgi:hypothetical protein